MKRVLLIALAALLTLSFAGCGYFQILDGPGMERETEKPYEDEVKTGVLSFSSEDVDGRPIAFSDFAGKKVVMLNFFEVWCSPCVNEIPDLQALFEK